ncbi:MAG: hypothetical protein EAZ44_01230 [Cytophagia bacterium]|nr:MAG: hypothetical protein EAY69_08855 [Cytophagales bacterium]TAG06934.1 MAG: hypothetical protein EAZ44_01230 [Cytophagia bacterium]TAH30003.1 MAG: hypothetical protein EAZ06_04645 [Cytophagales bacterium]
MKKQFLLACITIFFVACQNKQESKSVNLKPDIKYQKQSINEAQKNFAIVTEVSGYDDVKKNLKNYTWQQLDKLYNELPEKLKGQNLTIAQNLFVRIMLGKEKNNGYDMFRHMNESDKVKQKLLFYISEYERLGVPTIEEGTRVVQFLRTDKTWDNLRVDNLKNMIIKKYENDYQQTSLELQKNDEDFLALIKS